MPNLAQILKIIEKENNDVIAILGPTCSGKTNLAIQLAKELNYSIINADSRLIYKYLNIGTAKPNEEELNQVKHYLIDIKNPNEYYSAGDYRKDFDQVISKIQKGIVVGGTGFYIQSALANLELPQSNPDKDLRNILASKSLEELHQILNSLDPEAILGIDKNNPVRIIRAIEILKSTGLSLNLSRSKSLQDRYSSTYIGLNYRNRDILYQKINQRVLAMIDQGLIEEVKQILLQYGSHSIIASTIGYSEILEYLNEQLDLEQAIVKIQKRTRLYAKRQLTWFRQNSKIHWFYNDD